MVYYKLLLQEEGLSLAEGIVYSALISNSLMHSECFNLDGTLNLKLIKSNLMDNNEFLEYSPLKPTQLAKKVEMTLPSIRKAMQTLSQKHYIILDMIKCPIKLLEGGYLKLPDNTNLKGLQLVFYAYIREKAHYFNGSIDTWAYKLAEVFHTSTNNIYYAIHELHRKGFVERLSNGRLSVKQ